MHSSLICRYDNRDPAQTVTDYYAVKIPMEGQPGERNAMQQGLDLCYSIPTNIIDYEYSV